MNIKLNNEDFITEKISLAELLEQQEIAKKKGIAVALNNVVIPKSDWQNTSLKNNDNIIIITATQGG